jgi:hypothetical protein
MERLSRETILQALQALARELARRERRAELFVVGGAALVLLYGARDATKDVDAFAADSGQRRDIFEAAKRVAAELDLPKDWLNDGAKGYAHGLAAGEILLKDPWLLVRALAPEQLLAMKLSAWRDDVDIEDARLLLSRLEGKKEEIWRCLEPYLPPGRELKAQYAFEDLWEAGHGHS